MKETFGDFSVAAFLFSVVFTRHGFRQFSKAMDHDLDASVSLGYTGSL